jgi:hypothetical protein
MKYRGISGASQSAGCRKMHRIVFLHDSAKENHMFKLQAPSHGMLAAVLILAIVALAACGGPIPSTVCHATGDTANPYTQLTVTAAELATHVGHPEDIIPAPVGGCPASPVVITDGKITICHATSSTTNLYNEITVSVNGLSGHGDHKGDLIPAPEGGCPTSPAVPAGTNEGKVTICHATGSSKNPYVEITVDRNGLNGHDKHSGDIIPAPAAGCPSSKP